MTETRRVAVCGTVFADTVAVLGLEQVEDRPDVVLIDLADDAAIARAAGFDPTIPRVVAGRVTHAALLRALGVRVPLVDVVDAAALGPLIAAALPPAARPVTRTVVVTGASGGVGRTLLVVGLATRLAARSSVAVVDLTGSGAAGWWLGLAGAAWSDLEGLADELTAEHLAVVAAEEGRIRLVGGASPMPSVALARAAVRAAAGLVDLVIVDAPVLGDDRTTAVRELADRLVLVVADDRASAARLPALGAEDERVWVVASRTRSTRIGAIPVLRALPDDPASVRAASGGPSRVGGVLGRAYDDLAELIAIDAS